MKYRLSMLMVSVICLYSSACSDNPSDKIRHSLSQYIQQKNPGLKTIALDSIKYTVADSTIYFNRFLNSLADRSESFSKMAKLRADLAQAHMNDFLSGKNKNNYSEDRIKQNVDKSLEALRQNEREWDVINDSMDLMLNAVHSTDTLKKVFYDVSFLLNAVNRKAVINKEDFKVVFID